MNLAPIVLFVYNRPFHTKKTIESLLQNIYAEKSELFIFSDGAKDSNSVEKVDEVRSYINNIEGFKKVTVIKREKNWGLANSIIDGVTKIVNEYGKIIVLEDDLVTSPYFLKFMNEALEFYQDEEKVFSITGYSFTDEIEDIDNTYMLCLTSSWSWATWTEKWKFFKRDKYKLKEFVENKSNHSKFNFNNSYNYISMAKLQLDNKIDSWAIYWYFSVFLQNGLTLYPFKSLVKNIGFDGSGVHCGVSDKQKMLSNDYPKFTKDIFEKQEIKSLVVKTLKKENSVTFKSKLKNFLQSHLTSRQKQIIAFAISKVKLFFYKKKIGKGNYIDKTVYVLGWKNIEIGNNTIIGEYSWLNVNNRIDNSTHIKIGNNCYLGKRTTLSSAKLILIKDYCMIGDDCKFLGANHIYENPLKPYSLTGATSDEVITAGINVWFGANVCVIGNVFIGDGSIIGAGSVVTKDIPPFSIAVGNPCKVIKRFNFKEKEWIELSKWNDSFEIYFPSEQEYLVEIQNNILNVASYKLAASHRFGDLI